MAKKLRKPGDLFEAGNLWNFGETIFWAGKSTSIFDIFPEYGLKKPHKKSEIDRNGSK
jgi:hypothetical protein